EARSLSSAATSALAAAARTGRVADNHQPAHEPTPTAYHAKPLLASYRECRAQGLANLGQHTARRDFIQAGRQNMGLAATLDFDTVGNLGHLPSMCQSYHRTRRHTAIG